LAGLKIASQICVKVLQAVFHNHSVSSTVTFVTVFADTD